MNASPNAPLARLLLVGLLAALLPGGCGCDEPPEQTGLSGSVTDGSVRACDLLLKAGGDEVPAVRFLSPVLGEFIPKAPHVAVSFAARVDASLVGAELFRLELKGPVVPATLLKAECYDGQGAPVTGQPVRLAE
jgi:hypothetical protein